MSFNSNGSDPRTCDLKVRPSIRGFDISDLTGRTVVDPSTVAGAVHIIFDGQSTNNNCVNTLYSGSTTGIYNLSIAHKGTIFAGKDPILASDGDTLGHHGMYLARSLIDGGYCSKVLLTLAAFGGSYCADHAPGGGLVGGTQPGTVPGDIAYRIGLTARCINNAGVQGLKTIIDWQQGEWDSDNVPTTQANYTAALNGVIAEYKRYGLLHTGNVMFINKCTRISETSTNRNIIRAAQAAVVDSVLVRTGADIDTIDATHRYDGTHFDATGAAMQAALKLPIHSNFIQNG